MKSNNILTWVLGLAALGVTVYVAGRAWKKSQDKKGGMAGFAGAAGNPRLRAIASASRGGAPQYACNCSCGAKVFLAAGETPANCAAKCRDRCN
jgi:hypothetical protein